jgi:hypothetical protein
MDKARQVLDWVRNVEPVVVLNALAMTLAGLVFVGVIDTGAAEAVENAVVAGLETATLWLSRSLVFTRRTVGEIEEYNARLREAVEERAATRAADRPLSSAATPRL